MKNFLRITGMTIALKLRAMSNATRNILFRVTSPIVTFTKGSHLRLEEIPKTTTTCATSTSTSSCHKVTHPGTSDSVQRNISDYKINLLHESFNTNDDNTTNPGICQILRAGCTTTCVQLFGTSKILSGTSESLTGFVVMRTRLLFKSYEAQILCRVHSIHLW